MSGWIDAHVHAFGGADALKALQAIERRFGYDSANFLSVEGMDDAAQNALAIAWTHANPAPLVQSLVGKKSKPKKKSTVQQWKNLIEKMGGTIQ